MILLNERGSLVNTELSLIALLPCNYTDILHNIKTFATICRKKKSFSKIAFFTFSPKLVCVTHTYHFSGKYFPVLVLHAVSFPFEETKLFQFYHVTFGLRSIVFLHGFVCKHFTPFSTVSAVDFEQENFS